MILGLAALTATPLLAQTQQEASSSSAVARRTDKKADTTQGGQEVTSRLQQRTEVSTTDDSELAWMRVVYRQLDLTKPSNAALYFPEEPIDGQESLIRIIMRLVADGQLPVYEYLDGREAFTEAYLVNVRDMLDRFHVYYTEAKGSTEKNPRFVIEEADVPASEVLSYYIIERWEFDRRNGRTRSRIEALCPVLHRSEEFGYEAVRYPMFWVKYSDLRPYLMNQSIFVDDNNNLATSTYDDYFNLSLYDGEIYKTRNLRNRTLAQDFPDPDERRQASDSIHQRLTSFDQNLWVPSLEELAQRREAAEALSAGNDSTAVATADTKSKRSVSKRGSSSSDDSSKKEKKVKKPKSSSSGNSGTAVRSVRNRKR